ncbi:MAG: ATP-binding cassette domain-containing protein [Rhizobiales bacterium]|nr:ATP-binding cassette domain-containing protein [Hyphomicrobiales bacterium]
MLDVRELRSGYGNFEVLDGVGLRVEAGQIVALLGHNGAGKSTLLKAVFGLLPVRGGTVVFDGVDMTQARAFEKTARGMRFVPQEGNVFQNLSVEDNLRLGALKLPGDRAALTGRIEEIFATFAILRERRASRARVLSGGERQMLAISIALMTAPKLLLLDEPSAGLAPLAVARLFELIQQIRDRLGATVLLVEQNVNEALRVAEQAYVLEEGRMVFHGPSADKENIVRKLWRLAGKTSP